MAKAIHMMIRVLDEARSVEFYRQAFGLEVADRYGFDSFTLVYLSNSESPFELGLELGAAAGGAAFCVGAAACGARAPTTVVHARTSCLPAVKKVRRCKSS